VKVPYQVTKFHAWLTKQGFRVEWFEPAETSGIAIGAILVQPERAIQDTALLARLIREDLRIELQGSDAVDGSPDSTACVYVSWTAGDAEAWISIENIDDAVMRDAIMRLAS
jgi:hypothetical protein